MDERRFVVVDSRDEVSGFLSADNAKARKEFKEKFYPMFAPYRILECIDPAELERLRKDAERYRWLREHFRFANDSLRELWFDPSLEPDDSGVPYDLDTAIDAAMTKEPRDGR